MANDFLQPSDDVRPDVLVVDSRPRLNNDDGESDAYEPDRDDVIKVSDDVRKATYDDVETAPADDVKTSAEGAVGSAGRDRILNAIAASRRRLPQRFRGKELPQRRERFRGKDLLRGKRLPVQCLLNIVACWK